MTQEQTQQKRDSLFPREKIKMDAARRIRDIAAELHLTWAELENVLGLLKHYTYVTSSSFDTSPGTTDSN